LIACVDFYWEEQRTVGEFDGKIKYGRLLKPGKRIEDVIFEEKVREDALRDLGLQVSAGCGSTSMEPESFVNEYFALLRAHLDATRHLSLDSAPSAADARSEQMMLSDQERGMTVAEICRASASCAA
jgi:hypothetical protein